MDASLAALAPELRDADLHAWTTEYLTLPPDKYPNIARVAPHFRALDDPQNFVTAVQAMIEQVRTTARNGERTSDGP